MKVAVIILTKNEEAVIERCIASVKEVALSILVVDDGSTDTTVAKATAAGAQVVQHPLNNDFAQQRNWALEQVNSSWILFIDADEVLSKELTQEILALDELKIKTVSAFFIPRHDFWQGKELTFGEVFEAGSKGFARLVQKGMGHWKGTVHETWHPAQGMQEHLHKPLYHYPHQTVREFLDEINYYSTVRAKELFEKKQPVSVFQIWFYPLAKFITSYFFLLGFLNGSPGFIYSFMMSFHSFLVRAKLYQYYHLKPPVA